MLPKEEVAFLKHLLERHDFVLGEVNLISDLPEYVDYWRRKFQKAPLSKYCTVMKAKRETDEDQKKEFYFLSDVLPEDKELRQHLQIKKLQHVLKVQETEREDPDFHRSCLFCRSMSKSAKDLFNHMAFSHNFSVGQPDNLVFVQELLDLLEKQLNDLVCIFCEKTFKNRDVLKEHMRKKSHKKINPKNSSYDKFYVVNYLEFGKKWSSKHSNDFFDDELPTGFDDVDQEEEGEENDWSHWRELSGAVCLFCPAIYENVDDLFRHLKEVHRFDYATIRKEHALSFYHQIKLINFIRRKVYLNTCIHCGEKFPDQEQLFQHASELDHLKLPVDKSEWDQSQFFFPTYENDNLLCFLEDAQVGEGDRQNAEPEDPEDAGVPVYPEDVDVKLQDSILREQEFRNSLVSRNQGPKPTKKRPTS